MENYMNTGIFGGTFDPPHISHTFACLYALETCDLDKIIVIPCFKHPLGKISTPFHHRAEMIRLAMECLGERVEISEIEAERDIPSYTIDTLKILIKHYPEDSFSIIIGSDILNETALWKSYNEIRKLADITVIPRSMPDNPEKSEKNPEFMIPALSSTDVRNKIKKGEDVSHLIAKKVNRYIRKHQIYQTL
jgi:nicotinate-nucleotide adenylyltransferase